MSAVVHLELHTGDLVEASAFYARVAAAGRAERIETAHGSYRRSGSAASWAAASSSAMSPARCGSPTSGSSASAPPPSGRARSARRCCSPRGRAGRAGAASCPARRAASWRSGNGERSGPASVHMAATTIPADRAPPRRAARALLSHARLGARRGGRAPGGAGPRLARTAEVRGAQRAALVAVHDRHQRLPDDDRAPAQARAADRLRPAVRSTRRPGSAARRVRLGRALPRRAARRRDGRARGSLRPARERGAGVHRRAPASARAPARGADPARRARLLRPRGRRHARRRRPRRSIPPSSARAGPSRSGSPQQSQQATLRALGDDRCARWSASSSTRGSARTSTPSSDARRGRPIGDAARADLVSRPRGRRGLPRSPAVADDLAPAGHPGERPAGVRQLRVG